MSETQRDNRRKWQRRILQMPVEAVRTQREPGEPSRVVNLRLQDVSQGGLGATSPVMLSAGEHITVFFPPIGTQPGRDLLASVVRCEQTQDRFGIGLAFHKNLEEGHGWVGKTAMA
ncbi:MAG: PilZ domain-containing protein [Phycisphaerae bacterium]|jgi:hypothetical protein|nr:PilZ domain-containing protein [Phycisphaerae bacterium]